MTTTNDFAKAELIARFSTLTLLAVGLVELIVSQFTHSMGLMADSVDSLADAVIILIVWQGLRLSKKAPDERFHFGYLKVESLAALFASILMTVVASTLLYYSYLRFLSPQVISYPLAALVTLLGAGGVALLRAFQMNRIAGTQHLVSLKTAAHNSIKDASGSFLAFAAVLTATFGFTHMDAVGGMIIAVYLYLVAYTSIKEASLVLTDACHRPELVAEVKMIVERNHPVSVEDVRLRRTGQYVVGTISVTADGNLTLNQLSELRTQIRHDLSDHISGLGRLSVVFHPRRPQSLEPA